MTTQTMLITPEQAKEWLKSNTLNRPLRMRRVAALVRDIKAGNFYLTHQGIAFDEEGNLLDGQHRLTAIALAEMPATMNVTFGLPREAMVAVDVGATRNIADGMIVNQLFENDASFRSTTITSTVRNLIHWGMNSATKPTNSEVIKIMEVYRDEISAISQICSHHLALISAPIRAAALAALINGERKEDIELFMNVLSKGDTTGTFGCNTTVAFNFSRYLLKAKADRMTISKPKLYLVAQNAIYQFIRGDAKIAKQTKEPRYPVKDEIKKILEVKE